MVLPTEAQTHPTEDIIQDLLIRESLGVLPTSGISGGTSGTSSDWPIYRTNEPNSPDNIIILFSTGGTKHGRYMYGAYKEHPGWNMRLRSSSSDIGWQKIKGVATYLAETLTVPTQITIGSTTYVIDNVLRSSGPIPLGREESTSKRYLFSLNGTISLTQQ